MNSLTVAELKRRGMAAIEDGLRHGPVHIVKRNRPAAVVLSEEEYQRLAHGKSYAPGGMSAVQWLLGHPSAGVPVAGKPITGKKNKSTLDGELRAEREGWDAA